VAGHLVISQTFVKGSTYSGGSGATGGLLGCISAPNVVSDCSTNPNSYVGVNLSAINTTGANVQVAGYTIVRSATSTTFTAGDIICVDTTNPGYVIDNAATLCSSLPTPAAQVGISTLGDAFSTTNHSILLAR